MEEKEMTIAEAEEIMKKYFEEEEKKEKSDPNYKPEGYDPNLPKYDRFTVHVGDLICLGKKK